MSWFGQRHAVGRVGAGLQLRRVGSGKEGWINVSASDGEGKLEWVMGSSVGIQWSWLAVHDWKGMWDNIGKGGWGSRAVGGGRQSERDDISKAGREK